MNWALIGLGFISERHIKSIVETGGRLLMTCDVDESKNPTFTNWRKMIASPEWKQVTHVSICTPNYLHVEMASAMSNKVVLCEKPLGLSAAEISTLGENVFTVLQLRHHPASKPRPKPKNGRLIVRVKRDQSYWDGWKGDEKKSGGILFNLGVHYFDLLLQLFGEKYVVKYSWYSPWYAEGTIDFDGSLVKYQLEIRLTNDGQERSITLDGEELVLSKQDNLSFENLHVKVFWDLRSGKGISVKEALPSIRLIEQLK